MENELRTAERQEKEHKVAVMLSGEPYHTEALSTGTANGTSDLSPVSLQTCSYQHGRSLSRIEVTRRWAMNGL